jgi:hypothetical protein
MVTSMKEMDLHLAVFKVVVTLRRDDITGVPTPG